MLCLIRDADGSASESRPAATPAILAAYKTRRYFSVEFHSHFQRSERQGGGSRDHPRPCGRRRPMVPNPEYSLGVRAEVRSKRCRVWL